MAVTHDRAGAAVPFAMPFRPDQAEASPCAPVLPDVVGQPSVAGAAQRVGARVAELQLLVLLEEMTKRRLRVRLDGEPDRVPACFVHGYKRMMVTLERY